MSLYNEAGRRRTRLTIVSAVVALVIGLAAGLVIGRSSAGAPSAAEVVAKLRDDLAPVRGGLELIPTEYEQVEGGAGGESVAVEGDLDRIRSGLRAAGPDLRTLDPQRLTELQTGVDALSSAVGSRAPASEVERLARAPAETLADLPGGR